MPPEDAHPAASASTGTAIRMARRMSAARTGRDDIDTSRNLENERAVGDAGILAIVSELEGRTAALGIRRGQSAKLQRRAIDDDDEPVVVALFLARVET